MFMDRDYAVIRVLSTQFSDEILALLPAACKDLRFAASIQVRGRWLAGWLSGYWLGAGLPSSVRGEM